MKTAKALFFVGVLGLGLLILAAAVTVITAPWERGLPESAKNECSVGMILKPSESCLVRGRTMLEAKSHPFPYLLALVCYYGNGSSSDAIDWQSYPEVGGVTTLNGGGVSIKVEGCDDGVKIIKISR